MMFQQKTFVLLAATVAVVLANQQMPRFEFDLEKISKIMLTWDENWEVGRSNMLTILSDGKKIGIRVRVKGDTGTGMTRILVYKCPRSSTEDTIDLNMLTSSSAVSDRCTDTIPFKVTAVTGGSVEDFLMTMGSSRLGYTEVFNERIELHVKVTYSTGTLTSNKLFVWSLDAISSFSAASTSTAYTRRFLTDEAFTFMKKIDSLPAGDFRSVSFLDPEISRVLKAAPDFFKVKTNLGAILYFDAGSCLNFQVGQSFMFVNYHSKLDERNIKLQKLMKLNIDDGKLTYSYCGLKNEVKRFFDEKKPSTSVGVCTIVSFSGEFEPYQKADTVQQRVPLSDLSYSTCPATPSKACQVISNTNPNVTILSGMDYTAIVCPIICNDLTEVFRFFHDDRQLIGSPVEDWTFVEEGVKISKTGNIIDFPSTLASSHSGVYRCEAGSASFKYNVKVISLPQFLTTKFETGRGVQLSGLVPPTIFAIEGESLSYYCEVYFASLETVKVEPAFYFVSTIGGKVSWDKLNVEAFRQKVGADATSFSLNETLVTKDIKRLTVNVAKVPPVHPSFGTNFTHRFVCEASIAAVESMKVGMPAYAVQSGGDVVFVPRLTRSHFDLNPNNNCSLQKCAFGRGAFFEFGLTDQFMAYLNGIGVEVVSYLRIDKVLLSEVNTLFSTNASEIITENIPQRLAYRIYPISEQKVAAELVSRKWLTPVYNFRYKGNPDLNNLRLDKESHGSPDPRLGKCGEVPCDCRADRLCFYSTDFDIGGSLDFLPEALTFVMPTDPIPIASANAMIIGIVIGVICLIIIIILIVYFARRDPERAYLVEEKEIQLGHNPKEEAKAETFKEYQRVANNQPGEEAPLQGNRMSLGSSLSVASGDDKELDQYKEDIDFKDFGEQGSFIGGYQNDPRKKEAFSAAQSNEETV